MNINEVPYYQFPHSAWPMSWIRHQCGCVFKTWTAIICLIIAPTCATRNSHASSTWAVPMTPCCSCEIISYYSILTQDCILLIIKCMSKSKGSLPILIHPTPPIFSEQLIKSHTTYVRRSLLLVWRPMSFIECCCGRTIRIFTAQTY